MFNNRIIKLFYSYLFLERRLAKNTVQAYCSDLFLFLEYLRKERIKISKLSSNHFSLYFAFLGKSPLQSRSIRRKHAAISMFLKFLHSSQGALLIKNASMLNIKPLALSNENKLPSMPSTLSFEKLISWAAQINHNDDFYNARNKMIILFLHTFGLRVSELIVLRRNCISNDFSFLLVTGKGGKQRRLPIPSFFANLYQVYLQKYFSSVPEEQARCNFFLFLSKNGAIPLFRHGVSSIIKACCKALDVETISCHKFRHHIATQLLSKGANLKFLQDFLGHSSIETVSIYTHVDSSLLKEEFNKRHPRR